MAPCLGRLCARDAERIKMDLSYRMEDNMCLKEGPTLGQLQRVTGLTRNCWHVEPLKSPNTMANTEAKGRLNSRAASLGINDK